MTAGNGSVHQRSENFKKITDMKKIFLFLIVVFWLTSCYDDYRLDYPYSTVAFSNATGGSDQPGVLWRSVVKGEGLKLDAGIYLAGVIENNQERWVDFQIDPSILNDTDYELMPSDYYSMSDNSRFVIPSGSHVGKITITLDSLSFVNDKNAVKPHYAIPFRLTQTSEDSILSTQSTQILVVRYISSLEGFYIHEGDFSTVEDDGSVLNDGAINNVLRASTVMLDTVRMNGMMNLTGADFQMNVAAGSDVFIEYYPNPDPVEPENIALISTPSTDYVSPWENLDAINSGYNNPQNSEDRSGPDGIYGNWFSGEMWRYVQYDFPGPFNINRSDVYWFTDGGGLQIPDSTYLEVWDDETEEWVEIWRNWDGSGVSANQWNITEFDAVNTTAIRMYMKSNTESVGIIEWRVWGISGAVGYEVAPIERITQIGENRYDHSTHTFYFNYRVHYEPPNNYYHTDVSATLTWRNRIRDGVNEWRR